MAKRSRVLTSVLFVGVLVALLARATTLHSVNAAPLIYRAVTMVNDLEAVEGLAPPGRVVELWMKQRNFKEGDPDVDPFGWCAWKHRGNPVLIGTTTADSHGTWRLLNLRRGGNTVMVFPPGPGGARCRGGVYTELLPRACDSPGVNCTAWNAPRLEWLNVRKLSPIVAAVAGSVTGAEQAAAAVADGPNDGPDASDTIDVDENGIDTTAPGFTVGQRVSWRCGSGGTSICPSIAVHDASTVTTPDPEFPFILGTLQAHRAGGSFIAAAAIDRGQPIGFSVNVNVRLRGRFDLNLGCDVRRFFDFS